MTNVLITGGAGYIGSSLVRLLVDQGEYDITVVDNLMYQQDGLVPFARDIKFIREDVRNLDAYTDYIKSADVIIPLAALVGAPQCKINPDLAWNTNYHSIRKLIARVPPSTKIIYPNTNSGYGIGDTDTEGELVYCTEETPLSPISVYGETKVAAEREVLIAGGVSLRLATVFGVSPRPRVDLLLNDMVLRAYRDKVLVLFESHFKRNFVHVHDVACAFECAIGWYDEMSGQAYNTGDTEANMSKMEMAQLIKEQIPDLSILEEEFYKDPDQRNYIVSNEKLEALGWEPMFSIQDGISELINAAPILLGRQKHSNV